MANDPLGLSPDPTVTDPQSEDYLGRMVPLAFKGQPALPVTGAAAVGSPSGPLTGGGSALSGTGGGGSAGGGSNFLNLARLALDAGLDLTKFFGSGGDLGTRGETGGVSLSDYLRTLQAEDPTSQVSGGELALGASETGQQVGTQIGEEGLGMLDNSLSLLQNFGGIAGLGEATTLTLPIIEAFFGKGILNSGGGARGPAQLRETEGIRKDFQTAWPILKGAEKDLGPFASLPGLDQPEARRQALMAIIGQGGLQIDQFPAVSQFMSTEGGRQSGGDGSIHIDPLNVSGFGKTSGGLENTALLSTIAAIDLLGQMGPLPTEAEVQGTPWRNPLGESVVNTISQLGESAGIPSKVFRGDPTYDPTASVAQDNGQWYAMQPDGTWASTGAPPSRPITPEETAALETPGQAMPTLRKIFLSVNPEFDSTLLGQMMAQITGDGTTGATEGGTGAGPLTAPFTPLPGATPTDTGAGPLTAPFTPLAGSDQGDTLTAPLTAPFTPLPGTSGFGNLATAAMSQGGGGAEKAAEELGVAA